MTRIIATVVLATFSVPMMGTGQDAEERELPAYPEGVPRGMVFDEAGGRWRPPTIAEVVGEIAAIGHPGTGPLGLRENQAATVAVSLLRQEFGPVPEAEIKSWADDLADLILASASGESQDVWYKARAVLRRAAWPAGAYLEASGYVSDEDLSGEPAQAAFDALVRVYETLAARALANGGDDPFLEAANSDAEARLAGRPHGWRGWNYELGGLQSALADIFEADLAGRGWDYVLALFEASDPPVPCVEVSETGTDPPPPCPRSSTWCEAGELLHRDALGNVREQPSPGPDPERWFRLCPRWIGVSPLHPAGR